MNKYMRNIIVLVLLGTVVWLSSRYFIERSTDTNPAEISDIFDLVKTETPDQIQKMIEKGVDVNSKNNEGRTLLEIAVQQPNNGKNIITLLNLGADIYSSNGFPIFALALMTQDDIEVVKKFLAQGAKINDSSVGVSSLFIAAGYQKNPEIIKLLIKEGADVNFANENGQTPLLFVAENNFNPQIAKYLVEAGADVNHKNKAGTGILLSAAMYKNTEVFKVLQEAGAKIEKKELMSLIYNGFDDVTIDLAASVVGDLNFRDNSGNSPLVLLAQVKDYPNPKVADILVKFGADVNFADRHGKTPLMYAVLRSNLPFVLQVLEDIGKICYDEISEVVPEEVLNEITAEVVLRRTDNYLFAKKLIELGADVNKKDNAGMTATMYAAERGWGSPEIMDLLKDSGADATLENNEGKNMFELFDAYQQRCKQSSLQKK